MNDNEGNFKLFAITYCLIRFHHKDEAKQIITLMIGLRICRWSLLQGGGRTGAHRPDPPEHRSGHDVSGQQGQVPVREGGQPDFVFEVSLLKNFFVSSMKVGKIS
jgi:hypothetical protein